MKKLFFAAALVLGFQPAFAGEAVDASAASATQPIYCYAKSYAAGPKSFFAATGFSAHQAQREAVRMCRTYTRTACRPLGCNFAEGRYPKY